MSDRNCDMLYEYLKSILYDSQIQAMDVGVLDEPFRKLGWELQLLQRAVEELKEYSEDFSKGRLSQRYLSDPVFDGSTFRAIRENFDHLLIHEDYPGAGQANFADHTNFCHSGDVSDVFGTMASQFAEKEPDNVQHPGRDQGHLSLIESYNDLLMTLTQKRDEWIIVIDEDTRQIVYCNKHIDRRGTDLKLCENCKYRLPFRDRLLEWREYLDERVWEVNGDDGRIYKITTFPVEWRGRDAWAHIVKDITADREAEQDMAMKAYHDAGTGIYNRLYFMEYMQKILDGGHDFTLCYLDLDGLKYVNDNFGHNEGDEYIRLFVSTIRHRFRSTDTFARVGGDEFCLILMDCSVEFAMAKLESARHSFSRAGGKGYARSFSYGLAYVGKEDKHTLDEVIHLADNRMYEYKRKHKGEEGQE